MAESDIQRSRVGVRGFTNRFIGVSGVTPSGRTGWRSRAANSGVVLPSSGVGGDAVTGPSDN